MVNFVDVFDVLFAEHSGQVGFIGFQAAGVSLWHVKMKTGIHFYQNRFLLFILKKKIKLVMISTWRFENSLTLYSIVNQVGLCLG